MPEIPRLNGVIRALEEGKTAFVGFAPVDIETASALANSSYDGIAFEVEEARNAVGACRYPKLPKSPLYNPPGIRGDAPVRAARYWGLSQQDYYARADVWPLAPQGEILAIIQCEEMRAIENLPKILQEVPGIGVVLIGEGDLNQELGHPREYEHPVVADAINTILKICQEHNIPCGHPHPDARNIERLISSGYRFLMPGAPRSFSVFEQGRKLAARA
jgi:4-hydroxy-2-oxoheptanedioate aldolase